MRTDPETQQLSPDVTDFASPIVRVAENLIEFALGGHRLSLSPEALELIGTMILREARHAQGRAWEAASQGLGSEIASFLAEDDMGYQSVSVLCSKIEDLLP